MSLYASQGLLHGVIRTEVLGYDFEVLDIWVKLEIVVHGRILSSDNPPDVGG